MKAFNPFEDGLFHTDLLQQVIDLSQVGGLLQPDFQIGKLVHEVKSIRQKFMQRRVDQADDHRQPVHGPKNPDKILALERQNRRQGLLTLARQVGHDHFLDVRQTLGLEKHVLGAAKPDALRAVFARPFGILGVVRIGPDPQAAEFIGPG